MGLSSAMDWWDEWKLRILVLCSLSVQLFLIFSGYVRNWHILRWLRIVVWIAYIGGDALAIYALATLFNRQKQQTAADGGGNTLEVIWAPVLLIHLGGQAEISAYSLEDNELWKRHTITLVSQVTVALYVFCKWWSGEKRLFQAAILLFIVGIIRFCEKPWALRRASFRTVASTNLSPSRGQITSCAAAWSLICCTDFLEMVGLGEEISKDQEASYSLEQYVEKAKAVYVKEAAKASDKDQQKELLDNKMAGVNYIYRTFLDLSAPYSTRLLYLESFLKFDDVYGHRMLREWIGMQCSTLYTKVRSANTCIGFCLLFLLPSLSLASVVLFNKSVKDGYNKSDVAVTHILFAATAVMEFAPFWIHYLCLCVFRCHVFNYPYMVYNWQDMVSQHNIMLFCARKKKEEPSTLMKLPGFSYLRDCIIKHCYIWHQPAAQQITVLLRQHVEEGWKKYIHNPPTYRRFGNLRGGQTLRKHHLLGQEQLGWTFNLPFDECVLVWHIATDLCSFHHTDTSSSQQDAIIQCRKNSEIISNHMIYLLFVCPEMLMVGTRQDLFMIACGDIEHMIKDEPLSSLDKGSIARRILRIKQDDDLMVKAPMISRAQKLYEVLIGLDDMGRWEVIQGVWVEMLCYSASRCRGYEHAKSLAHGGEFLTNVWLLWSVMGMETLPDKIHNPGPPESDDGHDEEQALAAAAAASV